MTVLDASSPQPGQPTTPKRPFRLTRTFSLASLVGILLTATVMVLIYRNLAVDSLIAQENAANASLTRAFANVLWERHGAFFHRAGGLPSSQIAAQPEIAAIDADVRHIMRGLHVVKMKIYDRHGTIVFSTEPAQIGESGADNPEFLLALRGEVANEIVHRGQFNTVDGIIEDRDLLSSYLPMRLGRDDTITAVAELYSDLTPLLQDIRRTEFIMMAGVAGPMLLLYLFLFIWVRNADRIIRQHEAEERRLQEELLSHVAQHDALTGLPNRLGLLPLLEQAMLRARAGGHVLGVLYLDIDHFKLVGDSLGQEAGDRVLVSLATRIGQMAGDLGTLARIGGDEFVLLFEPLAGPQGAERLAEELAAALAEPISVGGLEVNVSVTIGMVLYPDHEHVAEGLIRDAEAAVQRAKTLGRGRYAFFTDELNAQAMRRFELEHGLRRALDRNEFELFYQPRVDAANGRPLGAEALLRWRRDGALIAPDHFIPLLEEMGLIVPVGAWVLRTACRQCRAWQSAGHPSMRVSVNLSMRQFQAASLLEDIRAALAESGLDAGHLELEITESALADDATQAVELLRALKHLGVRLAMDDFGTGYSSLSHLMHFPLDCLKIDRSFVRDTPDKREHANLATAIASMAESLGLRVVAEGVETERQRDFLLGLQVNELQGYLYSRPIPATEFLAWLSNARHASVATSA